MSVRAGWIRLDHVTSCGGACRRALAVGEIAHVTLLSGVTRAIVRCGDCRGDAPPAMPEHVVSDTCPCSTCRGIGRARTRRMQPLVPKTPQSLAETRTFLRQLVDRADAPRKMTR